MPELFEITGTGPILVLVAVIVVALLIFYVASRYRVANANEALVAYDAVAEEVFSRLDADALFLEYDSERAGGFAPLRHVSPRKRVVLGLVSTKTPELESEDALRRRIDEASRFLPLERLSLSPQCGFASTEAGNPLTPDDQWRKLALVVETAARIWQ